MKNGAAICETSASLRETFLRILKQQGLTVSEVASRIGCSRANVHQLLTRMDTSLTLRSANRLFEAIGYKVVVGVEEWKEDDE